MRRVLVIPALAAAVLLMLVLASTSGAWVVAGKRWPGPTVSVWNETQYRLPVKQAMQAWSSAGAAIRLVPAPSREGADVLVSYAAPPAAQGRAEIGYARRGSHVWLSPGLDRRESIAIATHELGHVLGLGHETAVCALMNPVIDSGSAATCKLGACPSVWRCLIQPDDARGLQLLYGREPAS
jgi:predicted Zn-dependent protease